MIEKVPTFFKHFVFVNLCRSQFEKKIGCSRAFKALKDYKPDHGSIDLKHSGADFIFVKYPTFVKM